MNKKNNDSKPLSKAELKSVVSLLNEILDKVEKDLAIDIATKQKITDIDIELAAQGKALEELQECCKANGQKLDDIEKKIDAILVVLLGPQIQGFTLDQITKEIT